MINKRITFLFILVCFIGKASCQVRDNIDYLLNQFCSKRNNDIDNLLSLQTIATGRFCDIDYYDSSVTPWQPSQHLERVLQFTEAYICPQSKYYKSLELYNRILGGLIFWTKIKPESKNWWFNSIKSPLDMGRILINMRFGDQKIPNEIETTCIEMMKRSVKNPNSFTGANKTDYALHWIYRACLIRNERSLRNSIDYLSSALDVSLIEGRMADNSFCQHGNQMYISAYGRTFLFNLSRMAYLLKSTEYAFSSEKIAILSEIARTAFFPTIRGQFTSFNVVGREISRKESLNTSKTAIQIANFLIELDSLYKDYYSDIIFRLSGNMNSSYQLKTNHNHFFCTDFTLHHCSKFYYDVRTNSKNTIKCETVNNENLKGYFLSDGGCCLMIDGSEYNNIFPVWDWARIPGVTAPHVRDIPKQRKPFNSGLSDIAGGVSDSVYGVTSFVYIDTLYHTTAKKSWFFFDDEIVCIGSDINSLSPFPIETTINQCVDDSCNHMIYKAEHSIFDKLESKEIIEKKVSWVLYNNVGYIFPENEDIVISKRKRQGSWHYINKRYSSSKVEKRVFCLGINHGVNPIGGSYSYKIVPNLESIKDLNNYLKNTTVKIVSKTYSQHAVYDSSKDLLLISFFEKGIFRYKGLYINVSQPCGLILKGAYKDKQPILYVANYCLNNQYLNVTLISQLFAKNINCDYVKMKKMNRETIRIDI